MGHLLPRLEVAAPHGGGVVKGKRLGDLEKGDHGEESDGESGSVLGNLHALKELECGLFLQRVELHEVQCSAVGACGTTHMWLIGMLRVRTDV